MGQSPCIHGPTCRRPRLASGLLLPAERPEHSRGGRPRGGGFAIPRLSLTLAILSVCVLAAPGSARASTCPLRVDPDVRYGWHGTEPLYGDQYAPDDGWRPHPGVVVMHGGGLSMGTRDWMTGISKTVACSGFVVLNIDYTMGGGLASAYADAVTAVAWLRDRLGGAEVGTLGTSSGAFLDNALATNQVSDAGVGISGGGPGIATLVTAGSSPLYMAHSVLDLTVPAALSRAVDAAYAAAGAPHRMDEPLGRAHGLTLWNENQAVRQHSIAWLQTHLSVWTPARPLSRTGG